MEELERLTYQRVRFNPLFPAFKKACEQFKDYQLGTTPPYFKIRRKDDHNAKYTLQVEETTLGLTGRCICKSFVVNRESVCKHIFIKTFRIINFAVKSKAVLNWSEGLKKIVTEDFEALLTIPSMDKIRLRTIYDALVEEQTKEFPVVQVVTASDMWEDPANGLDMSDTKFVSEEDPQVEQIPESTKKAIEMAEQMVPVKQTKSLAKPIKAFGGTVADIPKNLVITLGGKPYVTKAGLIFAASRMGLIHIRTEPIHWSWSNDEKRAVFQATVAFEDGKSYSAYGVAIPDGKNVKMEQMFPFVDHLAETRAIGRALRNAMAFRDPSVEEMPDYRTKYQ